MYVRRNQILSFDLNLKRSYFSISKKQNKNSKNSVNDHRKFNTSNKSQIGLIWKYSLDIEATFGTPSQTLTVVNCNTVCKT